MKELQVITKTKWEFAYFTDETGKKWYELVRIAKSLGINDIRQIAERVPESHKRLVKSNELLSQAIDYQGDFETVFYTESNGQRGGTRRAWFVDESGLYQAIMRSNSPEAEPFIEWLTAEVLPQIREHGYYIDKAAVQQSPEKTEALYSEAQKLRVEERNFSARVKQFFTQATDYDPDNQDTRNFFAGLQNLFLYAVTEHTAAEIVVERIDHEKERCGMVQDVPVVKSNLMVSKNYLDSTELQHLRNLCNMYLVWLETWKIRKYPVTMEFLRTRFLDMLKALDFHVMERFCAVKAKTRERIVTRELALYNKTRS